MTRPAAFPDLPTRARCVYLGVDDNPVDCERCDTPRLACAAVGWHPQHSVWFGLNEVCADCVPAAVDTAIADTGPDDEIVVEFFTHPPHLDRKGTP